MAAPLSPLVRRLLAAGGLATGALIAQYHLSHKNRDRHYHAAFNQGLGGAKMYYHLSSAILPFIDAETAHRWGVNILASSPSVRTTLGLRESVPDPPSLSSVVWSLSFSNPIGLAAGFDKDGECIDGVLDAGFAFMEVGSVTPLPQPGNDRPRVFRLPEDKAIINRYGFNSQGSEAVHNRLQERKDKHLQQQQQQSSPSSSRSRIVGLNLGKNKTSPSAVSDYCSGVQSLSAFADYLVVNISSPNTPNLRDLQAKDQLEELLQAVKQERDTVNPSVPLLVKIAPDLTETDKEDIADVVTRVGVDGLVISNTTLSRPASLRSSSSLIRQTGGLSGAPLRSLSTRVITDMYLLTNGKIPIIGVGGVSSGADVYSKMRAGASLVQLYTAFAYEGPMLIATIKQELLDLMAKEGIKQISDIIGKDAREIEKKHKVDRVPVENANKGEADHERY